MIMASSTDRGEGMGYDIIGDIHGHADKLEALLGRMGYEQTVNGWRHAERIAIFVGDFIDRGPHQLRTVSIVKAMVESGAARAVMGNNEFNAIAWHTPHPDGKGIFLWSRFDAKWGAKNRHQHVRFLEEVEHDPQRHGEVIAYRASSRLVVAGLGLRPAAHWPRSAGWEACRLAEIDSPFNR